MEYSTKNSELILEDVELMNYDINKITINRGGSCTINPQNKNDNNCFQYVLTVALNFEKIMISQENYEKLDLSLINTIGVK